MWLSASGIIVLFLYVNPTVSREVDSDSMIKNAILGLARIMRDNSQKLERHEMRERHLGDHIKRTIGVMTEKVSILDTLMNNFTKIEDRISEIEQLVTTRDERERIQNQKTANMIENLENRLKTRLDEIIHTISDISERIEPIQSTPTTPSVSSSDILSKLNDGEARLLEKISQIESSLNTMAVMNEKRGDIEQIQIENTKNLIENLENHLGRQLHEMNNTISEVHKRVEPTQSTPTPETVSALDVIVKINDTEAHFLKKVAQIESSLENITVKNEGEAAAQAERLQTLLTRKEESDKIQMEKTEGLIEHLQYSLERRLNEINRTISVVNNHVDIIAKLNDTEAHFLEKVAEIESNLGEKAVQNHGEAVTQADKLQSFLTEKEKEDRIQQQKTDDLIGNLEKRLERGLHEINHTISELNNCLEPTQPTPTAKTISALDIIAKLNDTEAHFLEKVAQIEFSLDTMASKAKEEATITVNLETVFTEVKNISGRLDDIESSLERAHEAIRDENTPHEPQVDIIEIIEAQSKALRKTIELIEGSVNRTQDLPTKSDIQALNNETQTVLQSEIRDKIDEMVTKDGIYNEAMKTSIGALRSDFANNSLHVNGQLHSLVNCQGLMMTTAKEVLNIGNQLERDAVRIVLEVDGLIRAHGEIMNKTLSERLEEFSDNIMNNHTRALNNIPVKMEAEFRQVWRQLQVMNKEIEKNTETLKGLDLQNEVYVNGTFSTMNGMVTKMGGLSQQINNMEHTLNNLSGRLSLVTQEFQRVKPSLAQVLDNIKASFKKVQKMFDSLSNNEQQSSLNSHEEPKEIGNESNSKVNSSRIQANHFLIAN